MIYSVCSPSLLMSASICTCIKYDLQIKFSMYLTHTTTTVCYDCIFDLHMQTFGNVSSALLRYSTWDFIQSPVQRPCTKERPPLHLVQEILYQDRLFYRKVLKVDLTYLTNSRCYQMCFSAKLPATTFLTWVELWFTGSGLFFYVFPSPLSILSCTLKSLAEIPSIFILKADEKAVHVTLWKSQHLYDFCF